MEGMSCGSSIQAHAEKRCADARRLAAEKLAEIERKIEELKVIRQVLRDLAGVSTRKRK